MRITENLYENSGCYTDDLKARTEEVFKCASQIAEARKLIRYIKQQAPDLGRLFISDDENKENKDAMQAFDVRMQSMLATTFKNIERYQLNGWKELLYRGDDRNGKAGDSV